MGYQSRSFLSVNIITKEGHSLTTVPRPISKPTAPKKFDSNNQLLTLLIIISLYNLMALTIILLNFTELKTIAALGVYTILDISIHPFNINLHIGQK